MDKIIDGWHKDEAAFANKYLNDKCGVLHLEWAIDHYWGLVTKKVILPSAIAIHDSLVKNNLSEQNKRDFNDADDKMFFIPSKNKRVFVHTTQNVDFLYIINERYTGEPRDLHIRRIYRPWLSRSYVKAKDVIGSIALALQHVGTLSEYSDDHYQYSHRPSLEAYRKVDFEIPHGRFYGDFRDCGYILSYHGFRAENHPKVEGSKYVFKELEMIATCHLACLASELEIEVPRLEGY